MKKYYFITILLMISFISCKKFLDITPQYLVNTGDFYKTPQDFDAALIAIYGQARTLYNATMIYLGELTTDNAYINWTSPTTAEQELDEMRVTPSNSFVGNAYALNFKMVTASNAVLDQIDNSNLSEELKSQYKGEAKFLRAFGYFNLVRLFGDVPIVTHGFNSPKEIQGYDMSRQPVTQVYQIIINDLVDAAGELHDVPVLSKARASEGSARTLLGKVYLTIHDYPNAAKVLDEVIKSGQYSLQSDYGKLFTNNNDNLPETIFEIDYLSGNLGLGNSYSSLFTPASFNAAIFPNNMNGSGRIVVTNDVINSYENGDLRRNESIRDSLLLTNGTYDKIPYGIKMVDFTVGVQGDGGINYIPLRYADVLLMYSEALNEMDVTDNTRDNPFNLIRERAGLSDLLGLSKENFKIAVEKERRVEFLSEGHRWFDLLRTGRTIQVINNYYQNNGLTFSVTENKLLMPIPQREIDINPNTRQNPGY